MGLGRIRFGRDALGPRLSFGREALGLGRSIPRSITDLSRALILIAWAGPLLGRFLDLGPAAFFFHCSVFRFHGDFNLKITYRVFQITG